MSTEIKMPQLGESVTEGTVGRWLKQPGEHIAKYEALLEVTTDKVDTEVPSPTAGVLREILVAEGTTVRVGTPLAILEEVGGAAGQTAAEPSSASAGNGATASAAAQPSPRAEAGPPISPVVARLAAEYNLDLSRINGTGQGGRVTKQDVLRYVEARQSQPALAARDLAAMPAEKATAPIRPPAPAAPAEPRTTEPPAFVPPMAAAAPEPFAALPEDAEILPISAMRRSIAEHMVRSRRTAAHVTTVAEVDVSRIVADRARHKPDFERQGVNLTYTPYFVQAVVAGLQATPIINASYTDQGIIMHKRISIGVAVALEEGLIVPVVHDADEKNLLGLARAINDLAERARTRRLKPDETQGGTFTVTNHGVSGSLFAMPIINQPQSAILGVGAIQKRAVVITQGGADAIAIRPMCYLSLTFDHRLIDGATADQFLMQVKAFLET